MGWINTHIFWSLRNHKRRRTVLYLRNDLLSKFWEMINDVFCPEHFFSSLQLSLLMGKITIVQLEILAFRYIIYIFAKKTQSLWKLKISTMSKLLNSSYMNYLLSILNNIATIQRWISLFFHFVLLQNFLAHCLALLAHKQQ